MCTSIYETEKHESLCVCLGACVFVCLYLGVCMCVCVCVREREREREIDGIANAQYKLLRLFSSAPKPLAGEMLPSRIVCCHVFWSKTIWPTGIWPTQCHLVDRHWAGTMLLA